MSNINELNQKEIHLVSGGISADEISAWSGSCVLPLFFAVQMSDRDRPEIFLPLLSILGNIVGRAVTGYFFDCNC